MQKSLCAMATFVLILFTASGALALGDMYSLRAQADSQFRIAEKAYRKAIREYGDTLEGFPDEEKASACRKMSSALHDNRTQYEMEDVLTQMKYKRQVQKLEKYAAALGCMH